MPMQFPPPNVLFGKKYIYSPIYILTISCVNSTFFDILTVFFTMIPRSINMESLIGKNVLFCNSKKEQKK